MGTLRFGRDWTDTLFTKPAYPTAISAGKALNQEDFNRAVII